MYLTIEQNMLLLMQGDTLVFSVPCTSPNEVAIATAMIMSTLRAHAVKQLTILEACIWTVTKREDLQNILLPHFT